MLDYVQKVVHIIFHRVSIDAIAITNLIVVTAVAFIRLIILHNDPNYVAELSYLPPTYIMLDVEKIYMLIFFPIRIIQLFRKKYNLYWIFIIVRLVLYSLFVYALGKGELW